jgi:thiamine-monophosphate kinase
MSRQKHGIAVSVALTGSIEKKNLLLRSGGKPGDAVFVTGVLGGTQASHHLDFIPRLAEGRWLAKNARPNAMMDLSDGLGTDLPRLAQASGCGFEVDFNRIPKRRGASIRQALCDGEDYELLFTLSPRKLRLLLEAWPKAFPKTRLSQIGTLTSPKTSPANWPQGWDHFEGQG